MDKSPRDIALSLVRCEAWVLEERPQIIRDCGVGIPNYGGEIEALDRAFCFGGEVAINNLMEGDDYVIVPRSHWLALLGPPRKEEQTND